MSEPNWQKVEPEQIERLRSAMSAEGSGTEPTGRTDEQIRADLTELDEPHLALGKAETYDRLLNDVEPLLARAVSAERRLAAAELINEQLLVGDVDLAHSLTDIIQAIASECISNRGRLAAVTDLLANQRRYCSDERLDVPHWVISVESALNPGVAGEQ